MNYNFDLDMTTDNSASMILRKIKPNSKVLEFGSAHGRMTRYMSEQLGCDVYIVEKDYIAGNEAAKYSHSWLVGDEDGDIEKFEWVKRYRLVEFDYIIFADVLEHLVNPNIVLSRSKTLLKDKGSVVISVPNIGHNSVLIDLFNNKFEYRPLGLCDQTHLRFFTHSSLKKMIDEAGFSIKEEACARCAVEHTEFNNSFDDVPDEIATLLKNRLNGDTYQFIWELGIK